MNKNKKPTKQDYLENYKLYLENFKVLINCTEDIINGMTEISACKKHNISLDIYRKICNTRIINNNAYQLLNNEFIYWEDQFLYDVFKKHISISDLDFMHQLYKYITKKYLKEQEKNILDKKYIDNMSLNDIAKEFNLTEEQVKRIIQLSLRKLRQKEDIKLFISNIQSFDQLKDNILQKTYIYNLPDIETNINQLEFSLNKFKNEIQNIKNSSTVSNLIDKEDTNIIVKVTDMNFSTKTKNTLLKNGYFTLEDLLTLSNIRLKNLNGIGVNTVKEILNVMRDLGYKDFCNDSKKY